MNAIFKSIALPTGVPLSSIARLEHGKEEGCFSCELSHAAYHADRRYLSSTGCRQLLRSSAHFHQHLNGQHREELPSQRIGSALHCAVLEPDRFQRDCAMSGAARRGAAWAAFRAQHPERIILNRREWDAVIAMRDAINSFQQFPLAGLIEGGASEKAIFFRDPEYGVHCKIRCDSVNPHLILELKATDDARLDAFTRRAIQLSYELQAAMYVEGCRQFFGHNVPFYFVAVETQPPHGVMIHKAGDSLLEIGRRRWHKALAAYRQYRDSGNWMSYPDVVDVLELPHWLALLA